MKNETVSLEVAIEAVLRNGPTFETIAGLCKMAVEASEAQQEPVAWLELLREARDNCKASIVEEGISASRKEYRIDLEARLTAALNTSPPAQRTWVGLTEDEINRLKHLVDWTASWSYGRFAYELELLLREKNA